MVMCNVGVTMGADVVIEGGADARLYLEVSNGNTITFCVDSNLTFKDSLLSACRARCSYEG